MRRRRAGFTLIEIMLAVVLIDVGLLALVAASAVLVRETTELRARSDALHVANNRIQSLAASPCVAAFGKSATGQFQESWTVTIQPNRVREVRDSIAYSALGVAHNFALESRFPCW